MTTPTKTGNAWILRSPCGCAHGATLIDMTVADAWQELAGDLATATARAGWTLTYDPSDKVTAEVRATLGRCVHPEGKAPRS